MKNVRIFVEEASGDGVWSVQLDDLFPSEFDKFFESMHDVGKLYQFFEMNQADLASGFFGNISIEEAVARTLEEADEMESAILEFAERGFAAGNIGLQQLFKPLNNYEYVISGRQKSKARIGRSWLRLYALRLDRNCYLVTGGAIKLTADMRREHLAVELKKLERVKQFLCDVGIDCREDLNMSILKIV